MLRLSITGVPAAVVRSVGAMWCPSCRLLREKDPKASPRDSAIGHGFRRTPTKVWRDHPCVIRCFGSTASPHRCWVQVAAKGQVFRSSGQGGALVSRGTCCLPGARFFGAMTVKADCWLSWPYPPYARIISISRHPCDFPGVLNANGRPDATHATSSEAATPAHETPLPELARQLAFDGVSLTRSEFSLATKRLAPRLATARIALALMIGAVIVRCLLQSRSALVW